MAAGRVGPEINTITNHRKGGRRSRRQKDVDISLEGEDESFARRLGRAMAGAGLDTRALARGLGTRPADVDRWLAGTRTPTRARIDKIAEHLGIPPDWLAGRVGSAAGDAGTPLRPQAGWDFRPAPRDGGRDFGNSNVWSFDPELDVFVREVLQNALDAAADPGSAVEVAFRLVRLADGEARAYLRALAWDTLVGHLHAAAEGGHKLGALLRDGLDRVDREGLLLLVVEDRGTVGLAGPERGAGHFAALCRNNLHSDKDEAAGGAFGLGKAVLWRASRLATVLFGSRPAGPEGGPESHRLFGRCELAWHALGGSDYAGPGWFGLPAADGSGAESIRGDESLAGALGLGRGGNGTSICVVGFHDPAADRERDPDELAAELARAASRNFFPAILGGRLSVRAESYDGRRAYDQRRPASTHVAEPDRHVSACAGMLRAYREGRAGDALVDGAVACRPVRLAVPARTAPPGHGEQPHDAVLLVVAADGAPREDDDGGPDEPQNLLIACRGPGMVVERRSLQGACLGSRPVRALLLCGLAPARTSGGAGVATPADLAAEGFLRAAEPPAHDRWTATTQLRADYSRGARSRLEQFLDRAVDGVRELLGTPAAGGGDGPRSLRDLLRLGDESIPRDRPRVVAQAGTVDDAGRWSVSARVRLVPAPTPSRLVTAVYFLAEGGDRVVVAWESLEATTAGCVAEAGGLILPAATREVRFTGLTDPRSHPVPAGDSCIVVDIRSLQPIREVQP